MSLLRIAVHPQAHPSLDWPYPASPFSPSGDCNSQPFQDFSLEYGQPATHNPSNVFPSPSTSISPTEGMTTIAASADIDDSTFTSDLSRVSTQSPWFSEQAPFSSGLEQANPAAITTSTPFTMATSSHLCLENPQSLLPTANSNPGHAISQYDWHDFQDTSVNVTGEQELTMNAVDLFPTQNFTAAPTNETKYGADNFMTFPNHTKPVYQDNLDALDCPPIKVENSPSLFDYPAPLSFIENPATGVDNSVPNATNPIGQTFIDPVQTLRQRTASDPFSTEADMNGINALASCTHDGCESFAGGFYEGYEDLHCHSRRGSEDYQQLNHLQHPSQFPVPGGKYYGSKMFRIPMVDLMHLSQVKPIADASVIRPNHRMIIDMAILRTYNRRNLTILMTISSCHIKTNMRSVNSPTITHPPPSRGHCLISLPHARH